MHRPPRLSLSCCSWSALRRTQPLLTGLVVGLVALTTPAAVSAGGAPAGGTPTDVERACEQLRAAGEQLQAAMQALAKAESAAGVDSPRARMFEFATDPNRGGLGLVFARGGSDSGLRLEAVTPGGPADQGGLRAGDRLVGVDTLDLGTLHGDDALKALHEQLRALRVGQAVALRFERDGKATSVTINADRPRSFAGAPGHGGGHWGESCGGTAAPALLPGPPGAAIGDAAPGFHRGGEPMLPPFEAPFQAARLDGELASYFGGQTGVLIIRVPARDKPAADLKPGDIVQQVDGEPVTSPMALMTRLFHAGPGGKVRFALLRHGTPMTLEVTLPNFDEMRAEFERLERKAPVAVE